MEGVVYNVKVWALVNILLRMIHQTRLQSYQKNKKISFTKGLMLTVALHLLQNSKPQQMVTGVIERGYSSTAQLL